LRVQARLLRSPQSWVRHDWSSSRWSIRF